MKAQPGFQEQFLSSSADITIAGGSAGPGKTFALLLEFCRHHKNPEWGGVIFRRTGPQITGEGGLWDTSEKIYPHVGGSQKRSSLTWNFGSGSKLKFSHLEYEKNIYDWQGTQIPFIGFDELTHFSKKMFFYLLTRNRSVSGIRPYMRATCNPDPDSWVADFIAWWIDQETGFPISERAGVLRYLIIDGENYIWGDTLEEVAEKGAHILQEVPEEVNIDIKNLIKSVTFVPGDIYDNKILMRENPEYLANLLAQDDQTKSQLLHGNWKVRIAEDEIIDYYALKDSFENTFVPTGRKYITADIALQGSDKFVVGYWEGWRLMDILIMDKSDGKEVIESIKRFQKEKGVPNRQVVYDNDGIGGFIQGFIKGSISFSNGGKPMKYKGKEENYYNLKTQCYYHLGKAINSNQVYISGTVSDRMYSKKESVRQRIISERRVIKEYKSDHDGKIRMLPKEKMKPILSGSSPDILDMMMMRKVFDFGRRNGPAISGKQYD